MRRIPKLELSPIWPALAAVLVAAVVLWSVLPDLIEETAADHLLETLGILAPVLSEEATGDQAQLQQRIETLAADSHLRLTVVAADGVVLADSERSPTQVASMDNHATRPEIRQAVATGSGSSFRLSATTGIQYAYAARTVTASDGRVYIVRIAKPLGALAALQWRLTTGLVLALSVGLLAGAGAFFWISRRVIQPVARLAEGAGSIASGGYSARLEPPEERHLAVLAEALNRMAERVEEQIAAVRAERDHLEAIVRSMSDGVLVTDREGRAQLVNPEFRTLFGLDRTESGGPDRQSRGDAFDLLGHMPLEIIRQPELARLVEQTLAEGHGGTVTVELRQPERRILALSSAALTGRSAVRAGAGAGHGLGHGLGHAAPFDPESPHGAVLVARDITKSVRIDEMRRDFVANVSHELKTPLSAIRGFAETLQYGALDDPPAARRFIGRILDQCRRLQNLLDDLLVLSRLESADRVPVHAPVDLRALARRAVETVIEGASTRGVTVTLTAEELPPEPLLGDRESLERLILNLVENAVKYNRPGGEVQVRIATAGPEGGDQGGAPQVLIEVADTGIGIPEADQGRIFERFYRVDKGRTRSGGNDEGGTGLGLAIVKHIVQSHGGRIEVESELEAGTRFRVTLPLKGPNDPGETAG